MKEIYTLLVKSHIIFSRMQRVNQHARPSIIQVGCATCCYQVCALDHANGGTADLDSSSGTCHRNELQSRNAQFGSKSAIFVLCDLKFDGWPWKTIGHLSYAASSFVHHFIAITECKLELQSGTPQFWSKSMIFLPCVTLKFDGWPWKIIGHLSSYMLLQVLCILSQQLVNSNRSYSPEMPNLGQNRRGFLTVWLWNLMDDLEKQ